MRVMQLEVTSFPLVHVVYLSVPVIPTILGTVQRPTAYPINVVILSLVSLIFVVPITVRPILRLDDSASS